MAFSTIHDMFVLPAGLAGVFAAAHLAAPPGMFLGRAVDAPVAVGSAVGLLPDAAQLSCLASSCLAVVLAVCSVNLTQSLNRLKSRRPAPVGMCPSEWGHGPAGRVSACCYPYTTGMLIRFEGVAAKDDLSAILVLNRSLSDVVLPAGLRPSDACGSLLSDPGTVACPAVDDRADHSPSWAIGQTAGSRNSARESANHRLAGRGQDASNRLGERAGMALACLVRRSEAAAWPAGFSAGRKERPLPLRPVWSRWSACSPSSRTGDGRVSGGAAAALAALVEEMRKQDGSCKHDRLAARRGTFSQWRTAQ